MVKKAIVITFIAVYSNCSWAQQVFQKEFEKVWENARSYTMEVGQVMPEKGYDFQPTSQHLTFAEHFIHISENIRSLYKAATGKTLQKEQDIDNSATKEEIIQYFETTSKRLMEEFQHLSETQLKETTTFRNRDMPKITIFYLMRDHMTHHRAQMIVYLGINDIDAPSYRGW